MTRYLHLIIVFSDASSTGCPAYIQSSSLLFHRNWSATESLKSSTWRELQPRTKLHFRDLSQQVLSGVVATVKYSLEAFNSNLAGHRVRWDTDNQNVVRIVQVGTVYAFSQDWSCDNNWIVPPATVVGKVSNHMRESKAVGTLTVPMWKSSYFWPLLCNDAMHLNSFV
ncbi:unnamed protein product [Porites lobata]|uniref:Uncharacterized protein n=1 Tax=Porites lobata TaxID=104759 RepID=A0ABN8RY66_9CNID|nr:unnamed protein product [Porites lobata]